MAGRTENRETHGQKTARLNHRDVLPVLNSVPLWSLECSKTFSVLSSAPTPCCHVPTSPSAGRNGNGLSKVLSISELYPLIPRVFFLQPPAVFLHRLWLVYWGDSGLLSAAVFSESGFVKCSRPALLSFFNTFSSHF